MGSNKHKPITFIESYQDLDKSVSKPMAEDNPDDLIGRTFLLHPNQKGEQHRASMKQKAIEVSQKLDEDQETLAENINSLSDVGQGRSQAIVSYRQVLNYLEKTSRMMRPYSNSGPLQVTKDHMMTQTTREVSTMSWLNGRQGR